MANEQAPRDQNQVTGLLGTDDVTGETRPILCDSNGNLLAIASLPASGTVTSVSVVSANGFAGSVATATTTPAITLSTTITGILSGNGTAISAASTTGSGNVVLATGPVLTTPTLGVASATSINKVAITAPATSATLTIADGKTLTVSDTMTLAGPNGSGNVVFTTSPVLVTPTLGVASATSINKVAITAPATSATLTIADGKTLTANNSITLTGTDSTTMTFPSTSATIARTDAGQTFTGTQLLAENASIGLDPAGSADGKFTGTTVTAVAGYTQAFGDLVYIDPTDSRWELADANSAAGADGDARGTLGMVVVPGTDGNACTILLNGIIRADAKFPTFTVNNPIYVSETAGSVTQTQPTTTDVVIRVVGAALTVDEMYFNPSYDYITHT